MNSSMASEYAIQMTNARQILTTVKLELGLVCIYY